MRTQLEELNAPAADEEKLTAPVGVVAVPMSVSITVTVQVDWSLTGRAPVAHDTEVEVSRVMAWTSKVAALRP